MSRLRSGGTAASHCALLLAAAATAHAGSPTTLTSTRDAAPSQPLDVVLYDRTSGRTLPLYAHRGDLYVAGEPGHEYEIRLRNSGDRRVLAVTSVDGVNVVTGRTAATDQPGYVLDGWSSASIDGWRKNLGEVASFYFTTPGRSYAARTGRPDDVGVIGVAMFREAPRYAMSAPPPSPSPSRSPWGANGVDAERRADSRAASRDRASASRATQAAAGAAESAATRDAGRGESAVDAPLAGEPSLGTGHGARRDSAVTHTRFDRASETPDAVVRIYYDSWRRLVARGVVEAEPPVAQRRPQPFPGGFVPDP